MISRIILVASAVAVAGCARQYAELTPAVGAVPASGPGDGAVASAAGVQVAAHMQAWHFDPPDLEHKVTPVLIEFSNNSARPVLIRYKNIVLADADGARYDVIPPYSITGTLSVATTIQNPYVYNGYLYNYRYAPRYVRYDAGGFVYDPNYYPQYVTVYTNVPLPTPEMVSRALPEGPLPAGATAGGFVYFKSFRRGERLLTLRVDIIDAASSAVLGTVTIPFVAS